MRTHAALSVLPLLFLVSRAAADETPPRSISTTGESVVYVTPDQVQVNFGIETFDPDLDKSKSLNDGRGRQLLTAIRDLGVEQKDIQTDTMQTEIQYHGNRPWEGIAGFFCRRMFSVKLRDTHQFEKLIDAGLKNGANQLLGFEFRTTELRKYRDQARRMAAKAAREKAIELARELDCGVGKPRTISEGYGTYFGGWRMNNAFAQNSIQEVPPPGGGDQPENLPLGQIGVRAQISVTFDLTDAAPQPVSGGR